jgi:hypothetical protein
MGFNLRELLMTNHFKKLTTALAFKSLAICWASAAHADTFGSRKHQRASTKFIAKPYAALVLVLLLFGVAGRLDAATVGVSDVFVDPNNHELHAFFAGLDVYTQSDLIHPTLTGFSGSSNRNIALQVGESVPAPGTRSLLLTHDFNLDTGITNPAIGATAATLQFSPPLINGPGPDLVMFEINSSGFPNDFLMQVNGNAMTYLGTSYDTQLHTVTVQGFSRDAGIPDNISQLENDPYSFDLLASEREIYGITIDLDDFAVAPLALVNTVHFGSAFGGDGVDPMLFMGIKSATIPGDFNDDRIVDGDDLSIWDTYFGIVDPLGRSLHEFGDADEDSDIDGNDFLIWQSEFGNGVPVAATTATIPEPSTILLAMLGMTSACCYGPGIAPHWPSRKYVFTPMDLIPLQL